MIKYILISFLIFSSSLFGQSEAIIHSNIIYDENIHSVLIHRNGFELSPPIIKFKSGEQLLLSFDDLTADQKDYTYKIFHCDADWNISDLDLYEYFNGFDENNIEEYENSFGPLIEYTHYEVLLPNDDFELLKSGNYIVAVYAEDEDEPAFTRRFFVVETKVNIGGNVKPASNVADRDYNQEVDFYIETNGVSIMNPYQDLKVYVLQNFRWDNAISDLQPKMIINNKLEYNYDSENNFEAGNEYRWFDLKTVRRITPQMEHIRKEYGAYNAFLELDGSRGNKVYHDMKDINGQYLVKSEDFDDSSLESEYVYVHFKLYSPNPVDGEVYIYGQLTDWIANDLSRMDYNYERKVYEKVLLLKQGFYNYQYLTFNNYTNAYDMLTFEGSHFETENQYTILAYFRMPGDDYDRLIGVGYINSIGE